MQAASGSERTGSTSGVVPTCAITRNCRVCSEPDPPVSTGGFLAVVVGYGRSNPVRNALPTAAGAFRTSSFS